MKNFFKLIDWNQLQQQKEVLIEMASPANFNVEDEEKDALEGVIALIDNLQDYATDDLGFPEDTVFSKLKNLDSE